MNSRLAWIPLGATAFVLMLSGCGGGGAGSSTSVSTSVGLQISTNWSQRNATGHPTGASEKITVRPLSTPTGVTATATANAPAGSSATTNVPVSSGNYDVHIDLYSGANASGTITGSLDTIVNTASSTSVQVAVGLPIATISVGANSSTLAAGQSMQFFATPYAAGNQVTFAAPGDIVFGSTNTSVLSVVQSTGVATGLVPGLAGVSATSTSTGVVGQTNLSVQSVSSGVKDWTIMIFMNASNSLESYALPNFLQMQQIASGNNVNLVVQWKESSAVSGQVDFNSTRRYLVQPSQSAGIASTLVQDLGTGVDMGSYQTLAQFISWAKTNYPANHYALDLWDHGDGWQDAIKERIKPTVRGISYDAETGNHIATWQEDTAFAEAGVQLDVLAYDACLMQQVECAYQVRNWVHYVVCSEDNTPGPGYDYTTALAPFYANPTGAPGILAQGFVDSNINNPSYASQIVCQSVVDETQITNLAAKTSALADALIANISTEKNFVDTVRANAHRFDAGVATHFYFDLYDLCAKLETTGGATPAVSAAAANVQSAITAAVTYNRANSNSPNSNGIAIDFSDAPDYISAYSNLAFAKNYDWAKWISQAP